jgi:hypothetical protein
LLIFNFAFSIHAFSRIFLPYADVKIATVKLKVLVKGGSGGNLPGVAEW